MKAQKGAISYSNWLLGTQWANAQQGAQRSDCAFGFTSYKDLQMRYEKVRFQMPNAE